MGLWYPGCAVSGSAGTGAASSGALLQSLSSNPGCSWLHPVPCQQHPRVALQPPPHGDCTSVSFKQMVPGFGRASPSLLPLVSSPGAGAQGL